MSEYQACMDACQDCVVNCAVCLYAMTSEASDNDCPSCCLECIEICELTVKALAGGSPNTEKMAALCAELCEWCAGQCSEHDHEHCIRCADSCRRCAAECRQVAA
jgi:hypothetical protein